MNSTQILKNNYKNYLQINLTQGAVNQLKNNYSSSM